MVLSTEVVVLFKIWINFQMNGFRIAVEACQRNWLATVGLLRKGVMFGYRKGGYV